MKLKINKACDLSSISVFPPRSRRASSIPIGPQQGSQLRSQHSQQSFSQGFSSQNGMFSQVSQTSLDESLTNDQRFGSQERDNPAKKPSCLPVIPYKREESQMPISRSSSHLMHKWSATPLPDRKCQMNEDLQHRIGMMETSLTKFGMILDSVHSDVMQANKGIKEVSLEMGGMRQKLIVLDNSLQLMNKGHEDVKFSIQGSIKSVSEQLSKDTCQDKLQQIFLGLSTLPKQMETLLFKLQNELCTTFTKEIQAMACSLKTPNQNSPSITLLSSKVAGHHVTQHKKPEPVKNPALLPKISGQATALPKVETEGWRSVKVQRPALTQAASLREQKRNRVSFDEQEQKCREIIDLDVEIDEGFSCLIDGKETGIRNPTFDESKEETARILRKARRQKRKYCNPIIIN